MKYDPFWQRVKALIKTHKITQKKFAQYIDVPVSTFYNWIQYNRIPDVYTAYSIATALGVSMEYLITGKEGKNTKMRIKQTMLRKITESKIKRLSGKLQKEIQSL